MSSEKLGTSSAVGLNIFTFKINNFFCARQVSGIYKVIQTKRTGENNKITFDIDIDIDFRPNTPGKCQHNLLFNMQTVYGGCEVVRPLKTEVTLTIVGAKETGHCQKKITPADNRMFIKYGFSILNSSILINKALIVHCDIRFVELPTRCNSGNATCQLATDYENLLTSGDFSDIVFIINNKEIKAHRNILTARSCVFSAMFKSDMKEAKENKVNIEDINHKTFFAMLWFIYSGKLKVHNSYEDLKELFSAADKYQLDRLKIACEERLAFFVHDENAVDCLVFSSLHNSNLLKEFVVKLIVHNAEEITKSDLWRSMFVMFPSFFLDVVEAIAKVAKPVCIEANLKTSGRY